MEVSGEKESTSDKSVEASDATNSVLNSGDKKIFTCYECGKIFNFPSQINRHLRRHTGERPFPCEICNKRFPEKKDLNRHILTHSTEKRKKGSGDKKIFTKCDKRVEASGATTSVQNSGNKKILTCDKCGLMFKIPSQMNRHLFRHTGERPFPCEICNKRFPEKKDLNRHVLTHSTEKRRKGPGDKKIFTCYECGLIFNFPSGMIRHLRTHTGEKPFSCEICNKQFSEKKDINKHMYTHTNEKPYSCTVCSKRFSMKSNLKVHIRTHTGEKNYCCEICNTQFIQKRSLNAHYRRHFE